MPLFFLLIFAFLFIAAPIRGDGRLYTQLELSHTAHDPTAQGMLSPSLDEAKIHRMTAATNGKKNAKCEPYVRSKFTVQPIALKKWWNVQQKKDEAQGGLIRPLNGPRPYTGAFKPHVAPPPRFNAYSCCLPSDDNTSTSALPKASELTDINGIILSFLNSNQTELKFEAWTNTSVEARKQLLQEYHKAGVSLWASVFGGDPWETPVTNRLDPATLGRLHGEIIYGLGFDGVDVDLEDFPAFDKHSHEVVGWTVDYVKALRKWLPAKEGFGLTAAPVAPWFTPNSTTYCHGAWGAIDKQIGKEIDYYNVQFYNQGVGSYDSCDTILFKSNVSNFEQTSVFEIAKNGVPLKKLVIGKPGWPSDAANGWVAPDVLSVCAKSAKDRGWSAGFSSWQYGHANSQWFRETRLWAFWNPHL